MSPKEVIFHQLAKRSNNDRNLHKSSCEMNWQAAGQSSINKIISLMTWFSRICSDPSANLAATGQLGSDTVWGSPKALVLPGAMLARWAGWPQCKEKCSSAREAQGSTELWNSRIESQKSSWSQGGRICLDFVCISNTSRGQKSTGNIFWHLYSLICTARPMLGNDFPVSGACNNRGI